VHEPLNGGQLLLVIKPFHCGDSVGPHDVKAPRWQPQLTRSETVSRIPSGQSVHVIPASGSPTGVPTPVTAMIAATPHRMHSVLVVAASIAVHTVFPMSPQLPLPASCATESQTSASSAPITGFDVEEVASPAEQAASTRSGIRNRFIAGDA